MRIILGVGIGMILTGVSYIVWGVSLLHPHMPPLGPYIPR